MRYAVDFGGLAVELLLPCAQRFFAIAGGLAGFDLGILLFFLLVVARGGRSGCIRVLGLFAAYCITSGSGGSVPNHADGTGRWQVIVVIDPLLVRGCRRAFRLLNGTGV